MICVCVCVCINTHYPLFFLLITWLFFLHWASAVVATHKQRMSTDTIETETTMDTDININTTESTEQLLQTYLDTSDFLHQSTFAVKRHKYTIRSSERSAGIFTIVSIHGEGATSPFIVVARGFGGTAAAAADENNNLFFSHPSVCTYHEKMFQVLHGCCVNKNVKLTSSTLELRPLTAETLSCVSPGIEHRCNVLYTIEMGPVFY